MKSSTMAMMAVLAMTTGCATLPGALSLGSAAQTVGGVGRVQLEVATSDARTVQYLGSDINAVQVTIMDADNQDAVVATASYTGASLAAHLTANKFHFEVDNLKVNDGTHPLFHYVAQVNAYLDAAETTLIGTSSTSAPFTVTSGQTTPIADFPALALIATPVGNASASGSNSVSIIDNPAPAVSFN